MPTALPDCPHCDSARTLSAERAEPRGVRVCWCDSCGKQCRVNVDGAVIHTERKIDTQGNSITGP